MGNIEAADGRNITIGAIHGFGQTPEHWKYLRETLTAQGIGFIAVDLPAGDPKATYEDYAAAAAEAFQPAVENGDHFFLLDHSMGGHTIPGTTRRLRRLGQDAVSGIIDISPSIGPRKPGSGDVADLAARLLPPIPQQRSSPEFQRALLPLLNGLWVLNSAKIRQLLFNECDDTRFAWALEHTTRPAGRPTDEPSEEDQRIPSLLGIPRLYIKTEHDNVRRDEERTAHSIGATLVEMSGDHSPAVSRPEELARVIVDFIGRTIAGSDFDASQRAARPVPQQTTYDQVPRF